MQAMFLSHLLSIPFLFASSTASTAAAAGFPMGGFPVGGVGVGGVRVGGVGVGGVGPAQCVEDVPHQPN